MNRKMWQAWMAAGMMGAALVWAGLGCDDDGGGGESDATEVADEGDSGATSGTITSNVVATTNGDGSISIITNLVFNPNPVISVSLKLPAPTLTQPVNGASWNLVNGAPGATVIFEWEAVSGAEGYQVSYKSATSPDFKTVTTDATTYPAQYPKGTNYWKVAALVNGTPQTWSETRYFIFK